MAGNKSFRHFIVLTAYYFIVIVFFDLLLVLSGFFEPVYRYGNKEVGHGYPINQDRYLFCEDCPDGQFREVTNSMGFKEFDEPKIPFDGTRVLFLGDSHMQGVCSNEETIADQFEQIATSRMGRKVDAQNGAYGGLSPAQYARVLIYKGLQLKPNIVVIGLYTGNDYFDLMRTDDRPWVYLSGDTLEWGEPDWVVDKNPAFQRSILSHSRVFYLFDRIYTKTLRYPYTRARYLYNSTPEGASFSRIWRFLYSLRKGNELGKNWWNQMLTQDLYFRLFDKIDNADKLLHHLLRLYKDICKENNIRLVIAPIPTAIDIHTHALKPRYEALQQEIANLADFEDVVAVLQERYNFIDKICEEENIEFYDLRKPLLEHARGKKLYYKNDFHINPEANRIIAEYLVHKILD